MTNIVERLRDYVLDDHERGCQGRCYDCSCGYDGKRDPLMGEAAVEIERLRAGIGEMLLEREDAKAEVERLRAGGCARDQGTTQYCAEAAKLAVENERLRAALELFACDCIESGDLCPSPQNCPNYIARAALEASGD